MCMCVELGNVNTGIKSSLLNKIGENWIAESCSEFDGDSDNEIQPITVTLVLADKTRGNTRQKWKYTSFTLHTLWQYEYDNELIKIKRGFAACHNGHVCGIGITGTFQMFLMRYYGLWQYELLSK